ncbi:site-specific recombinase XerD [Streptosporangium album]|uniref:Site-specific recombinase XerD n=1 Tax=Streptosporangium album TaxID=47479 RepID=A0A7W7S5L0_9ACTN|nr:site-specific integrase [Streptosporangium album]MBB4944305.1 site-specific recombinase XerD [Streptosporangium album]
MILNFFSSRGWESWDIERRPLIPERMPVLIDDDLAFEAGPGAPRPATVVNGWLRELPASGCPASSSWESYARAVKAWMEFLAEHGVALFDSRVQLKYALGKYAEYRAAGPVKERFAATTWGQHMSVLSLFYRWAIAEGYAEAEPFTYRTARALFAGTGREVRVNLAVRRTPKPHVTIKYLEPDFTQLFLNGLRGLAPDGTEDRYRGRELARNAAVGELALATGLRLQEFSYLLAYEIPALPAKPTEVPIPFPVPSGATKGRKFRTTWISYAALAAVHQYLELDRPATTDGTAWLPPPRWGEPLLVTEPDERGGRISCRWETLTPSERRRLVGPDGGSCVLAVKNGGGPFTAWASVFERTSDRIRTRFEPRFPHVHPHRLRHSFSMRTLEYLVNGHYRQAARLVRATNFGTGPDAALAFYLSKADPLLVLRDLLGHASVLTTEKYLRRLDTTRIFREAYEQAGIADGLLADADAEREADTEFAGDAAGVS